MDRERLHYIEKQKIRLEGFETNGWILDIGGGGEGVIGQLMGDRVVAIDLIKRELEEAPQGPLKIEMDAKELKFLNNTFEQVTSFFTLMFVKVENIERIFKEIYRVMKPGGEFRVWDLKVPPYDNGGKDIYAVKLQIYMKDRTIETGYGTLWPDRRQDMGYFESLGMKTGFDVEEKIDNGHTFYIKFKK